MATACSNTHVKGQIVQGPGACCSAFSKAGIAPRAGLRVGTTIQTKAGPKCIICELEVSKAKNAPPGLLVIKRGKFGPVDSGQVCTSSRHGCCWLQTAQAQAA